MINIFKKAISLFLVFAVCLCMLTVTASADEPQKKISQPTNTLETNGNGGKTDVGTWYITYNTEKMWADNFGSGFSIDYRALMPDGSYGIPISNDIEVIDYHLQELADAKIDFIIYDLTNGGITEEIPYGWADSPEKGNRYIVEYAKLTCQRIAEWNKTHDWKLRYVVAVGAYGYICDGLPVGDCVEKQAKGVYEQFVADEEIGDAYYTLDGKPLLIIHDWATNALDSYNGYVFDTPYGDKFTVRNSQNGENGTYGWYCAYGTATIDDEVELVCPGQNTAGESEAGVLRDNGRFYKGCWENVLNNTLPRIIVISSFNDYNEQTAVFDSDSSNCNEKIEEKWTDETGKINNSMYWDMTKEGIKLVRIYNGEIEGKFTSKTFDLGDADESINWVMIIIVAAALVVVLGIVISLVIIKKKKANKSVLEEENEENS